MKLRYKIKLTVIIGKLGHVSLSSQLTVWTFNFDHDVINVGYTDC